MKTKKIIALSFTNLQDLPEKQLKGLLDNIIEKYTVDAIRNNDTLIYNNRVYNDDGDGTYINNDTGEWLEEVLFEKHSWVEEENRWQFEEAETMGYVLIKNTVGDKE